MNLTSTPFWANSKDDKLIMFSFFLSQKVGFAISCKLSPLLEVFSPDFFLFFGK